MDTNNRFLVSIGGGHIVFLKPVPLKISNDDALNLAAWLVALADDDGKFAQVLKDVLET